MTAVLARDEFEALYRARYPVMVHLARRLTDSSAVVEELVQDAFARLHQHWQEVDAPDAYLRTSVVNACRSWHRSQARARVRDRKYSCASATHLGAHELVDAVNALPSSQRASIALRFYEDRSEAQIARALGCPIGTVKSNIHRGLRNLRKAVAE